jgi:hypothetical protein
MDRRALPVRALIVAVAICLLGVPLATAADDSTLTKEQIKQFLLNAKIVAHKESAKGTTHPTRLTLSDGTLTHDASYQGINESKPLMQLASGRTEMNFVDSYKYNIAAYILAEMLGLDDMLPVYVERKYDGNTGSLSWWLPVKMDEADRVKQKIPPPDAEAWNRQMCRIRIFDELVYDNDPNLTNVLIDEDWKIWRIDFTRAFRLNDHLRDQANIVRCDRQLLDKLKALDGKELAEKTKRYLSKENVKSVMARRDKIVARIQQMIAEQGEAAVLY